MAHAAHDSITQEAFSVAPGLIGMPLARPGRRAVAMGLDLLCVAFLVNVGGATVLGLALVAVFFRWSSRPAAPGRGRMLRLGMRGLGALVLFTLGMRLFHRAEKGVTDVATSALMGLGGDAPKGGGGGSRVLNGLSSGASFVALQQADDEGEARPVARELVKHLRATGMKDAEIRGALDSFAEADTARPWLAGVLTAAADSGGLRRAVPVAKARPDSLALAYTAALRAHDTARAAALAPQLGAMLATDTLRRLNGGLAKLRSERDALSATAQEAKEQNEALEKRGLLHLIATVSDELGLGFGWTGLYFTAFLALWNGQTPGKRLMGIRVVRLDAEKIGIWAAFERFGGYAASIFTGLLGFAQIFWDRNRQALHDKISETVVVRVV
ncbi:MAG: hypothetical protein JWM27_2008 [Gemmatimonadetes bacterium]|nr:hypothetical protein [Gemmatimonadota bacterium]